MPDREPADLLIEPRWLLPICPPDTVLEAQAVAIGGGIILASGPAAQLRQRFSAREHVVRERHVLLPGLVNAHTCAAHALLRGRPPGGAPWARHTASADFVRDGTRLAIAEMLRAGITCYADLSPLPAEAARTAAAAQMRALIALPVSDAPTAWAEDASAHLAKAQALWDEYRAHPRVGLYFAPRPPPGLSEATLLRLRRVADELDARIALQLGAAAQCAPATAPPVGAPRPAGVEDGAAAVGYGPSHALQRLQSLGLLRSGFAAVGALGCDAASVALLARHGATLVGCPQAELRLGATPAPLALLGEDRTGLGTDSPVAAGSFDLLAETRAAALLCGLRAAAALRLATLGGATALGLAAHIGSIEPGKSADVICLDLGNLAGAHAAAIADIIVFGATRAQVSDAWIAGRTVLAGGRVMIFDEAELAALPGEWARRLALEAAA